MWLRMINFKLWVHWRIPFLGEGGFIKNHYIGENCLKRVAGGVGQFPDLMEGLSEKEGSSWGEGGGADNPMHTMYIWQLAQRQIVKD